MGELDKRRNLSIRRKMLMKLLSKIEKGDFNLNDLFLSFYRDILDKDPDYKSTLHMPRAEYVDPKVRDTRNYGYKVESDVYLPWQNNM